MIQRELFSDQEMGIHSWFEDALKTFGISETPAWPDQFGDSLIRWFRNDNSEPIKVLSLFSGAGGLDIGFHDAGFKIVECNEIEKSFADTLIENSKHGKRLFGSNIVCKDINEYEPKVEKIDFIIGGPPCQTFSAAGARAAGVKGTDDDRGNLFKEFVKILDELKPQGFLFENVYRIVGAQGGDPWEQIQEAFKEVGYKIHWRILDAADYGVPQFRERLIIVGLREGIFQFPYPTHGPDSIDKRPYYTANLATDGVKSSVNGSTIAGRHGHLLNGIPPGLNYSFYTERMKHPKPIFGWRSKFSDYLYKADPNTPVRTIKAQGGQYTGPFHWENRKFTNEELKRLQTFPDDYMVIGNQQKVIHQIGNSVPPQLSRILALSIRQQVFDAPLPFKVQLLPESYKLGFRARKSDLTKVYAKKAADAISKIDNGSEKLFKKTRIKKSHFMLYKNLQLLISKDKNCWDYHFKHNYSNGKLYIENWDRHKKDKLEYEYSIYPSKKSPFKSGIDLISMKSFSDEPRSVTAIWKFLEKLIKEYFHKDDLVQMFGYYQYQKNYTINLHYSNPALSEITFWKILESVSQGILVGNLVDIKELSYVYKIEKEELISKLKELKSLGYEIRSHNTNSQIKKDYLLIPYSFPSLNERSLQRLTEL
jgi:DNA (cytosine-5)-methyltransferase 1